MHPKHKLGIMKISLWVIILGLLFLGYEMFLDGTLVKPVIKYNLPKASLPYDTVYFTPSPVGGVEGIYEVRTELDAYAPGEEVYITQDVCRYRLTPTTVQWTFVNDTIASLQPRPGALTDIGCYKNVRIPIGRVPDELSSSLPGSKYQLHGAITLQPNPFRKITYLLISDYFTIKK